MGEDTISERFPVFWGLYVSQKRWIPGVSFSGGSGTGVSPVCRLHDSHGRDARATTLEAQWPQQFRLPDGEPGEGEAEHIPRPAE